MKHSLCSAILAVALLAAATEAKADYADSLDDYLRGDFKAACAGFKELAEQQQVKAQLKLGQMYAGEECGEAKDAESVRWFTKAAEQGSAEGSFALAGMYYDGKGVGQSFAEAARWCRKAAEQGSAVAQWNLGKMFYEGKGVPQSDQDAVKWYLAAAEQRNTMGMRLLAEAYSHGRGVSKDNVQAYRWLTIAFDLGDNDASDLRFGISKKMTPEQITEAKRLAQQWESAKGRGK